MMRTQLNALRRVFASLCSYFGGLWDLQGRETLWTHSWWSQSETSETGFLNACSSGPQPNKIRNESARKTEKSWPSVIENNLLGSFQDWKTCGLNSEFPAIFQSADLTAYEIVPMKWYQESQSFTSTTCSEHLWTMHRFTNEFTKIQLCLFRLAFLRNSLLQLLRFGSGPVVTEVNVVFLFAPGISHKSSVTNSAVFALSVAGAPLMPTYRALYTVYITFYNKSVRSHRSSTLCTSLARYGAMIAQSMHAQCAFCVSLPLHHRTSTDNLQHSLTFSWASFRILPY